MNFTQVIYKNFQVALTEIPKMLEQEKLRIIGIGGRAGSGKTYFTEKLIEKLNNVTQIGLDEFHFPKVESDSSKHYDYNRLIKEVIAPFKKQNFPIKYQRYNFGDAKGLDYDGLDEWITISECKIIIIEGFSVINPELLPYLDLAIWIESNPEISIEKAVRRNTEEYKLKPMSKESVDMWKTGQERWVEKYKPQSNANILIYN